MLLPVRSRDKAAGALADHSSASLDVKNEWSYTFTTPIYFHGVRKENFANVNPVTDHKMVVMEGLAQLCCTLTNSLDLVT